MSFQICTVGCGWIANNMHGPAYRKYAEKDGSVQLAACCDVNVRNASDFQQKFGFARYYTDVGEMLDREKPDAVCLNTPAQFTAELAVRILERGIPLILEKPPGINREEALSILNAAEKHHVPNQVAFNRRYMPVVAKLNASLSEKYRPQEIQNIRCDFFRVARLDRHFSETAIHGIDTVRYLARSDYKHVTFHYQELPRLGEGVANVFMECVFRSGATGQLAFCPVAGVAMERITVNALGDTWFANLPVWGSVDVPGRLLWYHQNKILADLAGDTLSGGAPFETGGFYREDASFFDEIRGGGKPDGDVGTALQSVEIADCIRNRLPRYDFAG